MIYYGPYHYLKSFICIISFNTQTIRSIFTITLIFFFQRVREPTTSHRAVGWELNLASLTPDSVVLNELYHFDVETHLRVSSC